MGQQLARISGFSEFFFSLVLIKAVLSSDETRPVARELFMIAVMRRLMTVSFDLMSAVYMGSSALVEELTWQMTFSASL